MKKKKNVYKPKRHPHLLSNILSIMFTLVIASFFAVIGYSVAKPFGEIGEISSSRTDSGVNDNLETVESESVKIPRGFKAYWIKDREIPDLKTLQSTLDSISTSEYNMVIVPLKIEGGTLNYNSSNEGAVLAEAGNELSLSSVIEAVKASGFTPAASINTMQDNLYPKANKNAGFLLESSKALWLDSNNKEKGKPWMDPSSSASKEYLSSLTGEIAQAGFEYIISTNVEYPAFSENALKDIGSKVTDSNRYLDLIDTVNTMNKIAEDKDSNMWIEIPAYEMLTGTCEVFQPILLNTQKYVLKIDLSKFNSEIECNGKKINFASMSIGEKVKTICEETETKIYKTSFIPEISSLSLTSTQKAEIYSTFSDLKYDSYIIR
ncbi:putative glycoside hydrolase [Porcipelethomonas sp.]|uniref:putative glycoside hydrolase n=1 Tax=Porcipelethomonas sp. TaxID=2981675 RepID=UPI003EF73667